MCGFAGLPAGGNCGQLWQVGDKSQDVNGSSGLSEASGNSHFSSGHIVARAQGDSQASGQPTPPLMNTNLATMESAIATPTVSTLNFAGELQTVRSRGLVRRTFRLQHELATRSTFDAAPQQPQHTRRLSRFGPNAVHGRSDSANSLVAPHSRRSSTSEMSHSGAMSEAESVGSLVRRSSDADAQVKRFVSHECLPSDDPKCRL